MDARTDGPISRVIEMPVYGTKNAGKQDPVPVSFHFRIVSDQYNFIRQQNMTEHTSSQL